MSTSNRLARSRSNRRVAGVCGGIADFTGLSATWVRLGFGIFGIGEVVYLIMWLVVPKR